MIGSERRAVVIAVAVAAIALFRQAPAETAPDEAGVLVMQATTMTAPAEKWTISLSRWPSDAERAPLMAALAAAPARQGGAAGPPGEVAGPPAGAGRGTAGAPAGAAGGRGGRGGARGGRGAATPSSPMARLASAIKAAPTVGFIWGSGVTGYSIKYAWRSPGSGPPERVVLITDRRVGLRPASAHDVPATPATPPSSEGDQDFTLLEIQFDAAGRGEGRTSLMSPVVIDQAAGTLALDRTAAAAVLLRVSR